MKNLLIVGAALIAIIASSQYLKRFDNQTQSVNKIIGDVSFVKKFGYLPNLTTDNTLRIKTHLEYVENILRQQDVTHLSSSMQTKRKSLIDLLHDYRLKGLFPENNAYAGERKPCFIDENGAICAVGYLIEKTAGRQIAETINKKFQYSEIMDMDNHLVDNWVASSGLTKQECAMIQPTYGYGKRGRIATGFTVVNTGINVVNAININQGTKSKIVPILGFFTGVGQIWVGAQYFETGKSSISPPNKTQAILNAGNGVLTIVLSTINLHRNRDNYGKGNNWSFYNVTMPDNSKGVALGFSKNF
jgi:hypothetical protein